MFGPFGWTKDGSNKHEFMRFYHKFELKRALLYIYNTNQAHYLGDLTGLILRLTIFKWLLRSVIFKFLVTFILKFFSRNFMHSKSYKFHDSSLLEMLNGKFYKLWYILHRVLI